MQTRGIGQTLRLTEFCSGEPSPILLMFLSADYGFGLGAEPFIVANCEVCNCETTTNRSRLEEADAVVIHPRNIYVNLWDKYGFANTWIKWNLIPIGFMDLPPVR